MIHGKIYIDSPVFLARKGSYFALFFRCQISIIVYVFSDADYDGDVQSCPNLVDKKVMDIFWTEMDKKISFR